MINKTNFITLNLDFMQNLLQKAYDLLKKDERLISTEWDLLKNKVQELANKLDEKLIGLLYSDETMRTGFFKQIDKVWLFDSHKFIRFINNKEFLADSYTAFKNKIGLTDGREEFITEGNDVVLNRPYKDCVLAGWQDKEDTKRDEIFYNEILWSDEIDRLLDPKVFTNFKKYDKDWEHELKERTKDKNGDIKDNLIIKGNNLLVLHSLKKKFAGKVKLIYIDPPYNTGNDWFKYNDRFNHSTWLTFMKNRLEVAKELLKDDWSIFVQCDDNEQAYLKVLMDEIFWIDNLNSIITVKVSSESGVKVNANKPVRVKEYILIYTKKSEWVYNKQYVVSNKYDQNYSYYVDDPLKEPNKWNISNIKKKYMEVNKKEPSEKDLMNFQIKYKNNIFSVRDISASLKKLFWDEPNQFIIKENENKKTILWKKWEVVFFSNKVNNVDWEECATKYLSDIRMDIKRDWIANEWWVILKWWKKPERLIKRIIEMWSKEWDIILDYHLWSWTTCAVAHKMNRQYIGIEQLEYLENWAITRVNNVISWEETWISRIVNRQGWWSFVYMETVVDNIKYIETVKQLKEKSELIDLYNALKDNIYVNYKIDIRKMSENISSFEKLSITDMQSFILDIIDQNALYLNYSEIMDSKYNISAETIKLNTSFYQ